MQDDHVLEILDRGAAKGITAWVDGGWGIDALLERQTREHSDLDLAIDASAVPEFTTDLLAKGFFSVRIGCQPQSPSRTPTAGKSTFIPSSSVPMAEAIRSNSTA